MYDQIIPKEEFDQLPIEEQKKAIEHWRKIFKAIDVKKAWRITDSQYYSILNKLGIKRNSYATTRPEPSRSVASQPRTEARTEVVEVVTKKDLLEALSAMRLLSERKQEEDNKDGISLGMKGRYDPKTAAAKLLKFAQMIEDEQADFNITVLIEEVTEA